MVAIRVLMIAKRVLMIAIRVLMIEIGVLTAANKAYLILIRLTWAPRGSRRRVRRSIRTRSASEASTRAGNFQPKPCGRGAARLTGATGHTHWARRTPKGLPCLAYSRCTVQCAGA